MSFEFTDTGLQIQTFDEIYQELVAAYKAIYGSDINLDQDTPDGQRIAIEAKARLDSQSFALSIYNAMDPDLASGESLNKIIKLAGIVRKPATLSQVDLDITTDRDLTLATGYQVQDDIGQLWQTTAERALSTGVNVVTVVAVDFGPIEAVAATITTPVTVVIGVTDVTNPLDAAVGSAEETDAELRVRRNKSLQSPATSTVGGLFSVLGNLPSVTDLVIYENDTDSLDATLSLAAHSIWVVIEGGVVADIGEAMAKNKTGGTGLKGAEEITYVETVTLASGLDITFNHEMKFDRPIEQQLFVRMDATEKNPPDPIPFDDIKAELVARVYKIAEDVQAGDLYRNVYAAGDNFIPTDLEISDDGVIWTDGQLLVGAQGKFTLDTADITITDIT